VRCALLGQLEEPLCGGFLGAWEATAARFAATASREFEKRGVCFGDEGAQFKEHFVLATVVELAKLRAIQSLVQVVFRETV
jgi:hypothetical protein